MENPILTDIDKTISSWSDYKDSEIKLTPNSLIGQYRKSEREIFLKSLISIKTKIVTKRQSSGILSSTYNKYIKVKFESEEISIVAFFEKKEKEKARNMIESVREQTLKTKE